jgi:pimeloyl-ACP methyl ester carboxylesterase
MCGFSMGGVHASMVASLYPGNVACTPLLAPRSASGAFCHGALRSATSWAPLAAVVDEKQQVSTAVDCIVVGYHDRDAEVPLASIINSACSVCAWNCSGGQPDQPHAVRMQ